MPTCGNQNECIMVCPQACTCREALWITYICPCTFTFLTHELVTIERCKMYVRIKVCRLVTKEIGADPKVKEDYINLFFFRLH